MTAVTINSWSKGVSIKSLIPFYFVNVTALALYSCIRGVFCDDWTLNLFLTAFNGLQGWCLYNNIRVHLIQAYTVICLFCFNCNYNHYLLYIGKRFECHTYLHQGSKYPKTYGSRGRGQLIMYFMLRYFPMKLNSYNLMIVYFH